MKSALRRRRRRRLGARIERGTALFAERFVYALLAGGTVRFR